ncbi:MAG: hypothetical protein J0H14_02725 [Alphaproteobacteria bacterium]|nr:hypothetical protein [Alphaproteobacteria bacterium]
MSDGINLLQLEPGARLRLANGAIVELVENPRDGSWLLCRYLADPTDPAVLGDEEHMIFVRDITALA